MFHLVESWVDRFRAVISATNDSLSFDQIHLVTFNGHTSAIRQIRVLDNENSFITASQDKTGSFIFWMDEYTCMYSCCSQALVDKDHRRNIQLSVDIFETSEAGERSRILPLAFLHSICRQYSSHMGPFQGVCNPST